MSAARPTKGEVRFAIDSPLEGAGFEPSVPRERFCAFETVFTPCNRSGARYAANDPSMTDGPLLFGLDIHGQYLLVDAERASVGWTASGSG
jgi:hypothetical protein